MKRCPLRMNQDLFLFDPYEAPIEDTDPEMLDWFPDYSFHSKLHTKAGSLARFLKVFSRTVFYQGRINTLPPGPRYIE